MDKKTVASLTDDELIDKIISENNSELFGILYQKYRQKVTDKCYGFIKNKDLALEFTEEIFSKTFEKLDTFNHTSKFSSWLYSITYNYCIDYLRHRKKLHYPEWNRQNSIPEIIDETDEDFTELNYQRLMEIFEMIHPEEKALLFMKYQDNLPMKHIAVTLRVSEDAAKMRLKRARTRVLYLYREKFGHFNAVILLLFSIFTSKL